MEFLNTCDIDYGETLSENHWRNPCALAVVYPIGLYRHETDISYRPILTNFLHNKVPTLSFKDWYEQPIFETWDGNLLSRKAFVLTMSNQDGGRHVDPTIRDMAYHWLSRGRAGCGYRPSGEGFEVIMPLSMNGRLFELPADMKPVPNAHWATMRQIGLEVEASFVLAGKLEKWPAPQGLVEANLHADHPYRRLLKLPPYRPRKRRPQRRG